MPEQILIAPELENRQELVVLPSVDDFFELSEEELKAKEMVLKHKLLMRPGEHNGKIYSWEDLEAALQTGEEAGLFYDHEDSTKNYVGFVRNLTKDEVKKEIYGDLVFLEEKPYKILKAGAKWGVSPSIDAEPVVRDGKTYALDPKFMSFSLVLRPAVRETMLNENIERRSKVDMEDSQKREIEELAKKKKDEEEKKKKEEEEKKKKLESELKETKDKLAAYEEKELEASCTEILNLEKQIGFTSEAEVDERLKKLKEISAETRSELKSIHERYIKTLGLNKDEDKSPEELGEELKENYLKFRARFMKKNPKATESDVKKAYAKLAAEVDDKKKKKYPYPYPYPKAKGKMSEDLEESQERMKQNLSDDQAERDKSNQLFLDHMHAAERGELQ